MRDIGWKLTSRLEPRFGLGVHIVKTVITLVGMNRVDDVTCALRPSLACIRGHDRCLVPAARATSICARGRCASGRIQMLFQQRSFVAALPSIHDLERRQTDMRVEDRLSIDLILHH